MAKEICMWILVSPLLAIALFATGVLLAMGIRAICEIIRNGV